MSCTLCNRPVQARGLCNTHYSRWRLTGDPTKTPLQMVDPKELAAGRFWKKVKKSHGCWYWEGAQSRGYGVTEWEGRNRQAHRVSWELLRGPIPAGLQLDHMCQNRLCVNPNHLDPVTPKENTWRRPRRTHCRKGHELAGDNLYVRPSDKARICRTCQQGYRSAPRG